MTDEQPLTQRRQVLASLGSLAFLSEYLGGPAESSTETVTTTGTSTFESKSAESGRATTTTSDCGRTELCKGSEFVRVRVDGDFSGRVMLSLVCRESDVGLSSGEIGTLIRQTDAGACNVELLVDGEVAYDGRIQGYEYMMVRVSSDGEISLQKEVL